MSTKPRGRTFEDAVAIAREKKIGRPVDKIRRELEATARHAQKVAADVADVNEKEDVGAAIHAKAKGKYAALAQDYAALKIELTEAESRAAL